jgi:molybdopterin synthase catalytic subunit
VTVLVRNEKMLMKEDFSIDELVRRMKKPELGAMVMFLGMVRADEGVKGMNITGNEERAAEELEKLKEEALAKFEIETVEFVHRVGSLPVGERILAILVGAKHRKDAFQACEYLIDTLKLNEPLRKETF